MFAHYHLPAPYPDMATTEGFHKDQRVPFYAVPELGSVFYGLPNTSHGQINRYFRQLDPYFKPGDINYFKGNVVYPGEWSPTEGMSPNYYAATKLSPEQQQEINEELSSRYAGSLKTGSVYKWVYGDGDLQISPPLKSILDSPHHFDMLNDMGYLPEYDDVAGSTRHVPQDFACGIYDTETPGEPLGLYERRYQAPSKEELQAYIEHTILPDHTGSYFLETQTITKTSWWEASWVYDGTTGEVYHGYDHIDIIRDIPDVMEKAELGKIVCGWYTSGDEGEPIGVAVQSDTVNKKMVGKGSPIEEEAKQAALADWEYSPEYKEASTGLPVNNHDIFGMDPDIGAVNTPFIYYEGRVFTHPSARYHGDIVSNMAPEERQSIHWPSAIQGRYDPDENEYAIYHNEYPPVEYNDDEIAQALHQHFRSPKGHIASSPDDLHRFVYHRGRVKMAPSWDTYHQALANELLSENEPATAPYGFAGGFYRPSTGELNRGEKLSLGGPPVPDEVLAQALRDKASELYGSSVHAAGVKVPRERANIPWSEPHFPARRFVWSALHPEPEVGPIIGTNTPPVHAQLYNSLAEKASPADPDQMWGAPLFGGWLEYDPHTGQHELSPVTSDGSSWDDLAPEHQKQMVNALNHWLASENDNSSVHAGARIGGAEPPVQMHQ